SKCRSHGETAGIRARTGRPATGAADERHAGQHEYARNPRASRGRGQRGQPMNPPNVRGELPTSRRILLAAFVLFLLSSCLLSPSATEQMVFGWIYFPLRVLPQVTIDWPAVMLGTICTALFFAGLHMLLGRCVRQLGPSHATRKVSLRLSGL